MAHSNLDAPISARLAVSAAPTVSFVIPVRNDARRLRRCLAQIRANRYPADRLEIVVVDNGSTDDSAEVARQAGANVIVRPGLSVSQLRNLGADRASGEILAFVDADHEIVPDWVDSAVETLRRTNVALVGAPYEAPADGTWVQRTYDLLRPRRGAGLREAGWLGSGNMAMWRRTFEGIGGFDSSLQTCEDVDLCQRIRRGGSRILEDPRLRSVHWGDPRSLAAIFRGELWRGRDNLRVSLRGPFGVRQLPSLLVPLADLGLLIVAVGGLTAGVTGFQVTALALGAILGASAARAARMVLQHSRIAPLQCAQALAVATVYDVARALALISPGRHEGRRR